MVDIRFSALGGWLGGRGSSFKHFILQIEGPKTVSDERGLMDLGGGQQKLEYAAALFLGLHPFFVPTLPKKGDLFFYFLSMFGIK